MLKNSLGTRLFVAAILTLALTFFAASPIVSARASYINYKVTSVSTHNGYATLHGYFYNSGNSGATVKAVRFRGYIGDVYINADVEDMSVWVGAGSNVDYTISIYGDGITSRTSENSSLQTSTVTD